MSILRCHLRLNPSDPPVLLLEHHLLFLSKICLGLRRHLIRLSCLYLSNRHRYPCRVPDIFSLGFELKLSNRLYSLFHSYGNHNVPRSPHSVLLHSSTYSNPYCFHLYRCLNFYGKSLLNSFINYLVGLRLLGSFIYRFRFLLYFFHHYLFYFYTYSLPFIIILVFLMSYYYVVNFISVNIFILYFLPLLSQLKIDQKSAFISSSHI